MSSGTPLKKRLYNQQQQFFPKQKASRLKSKRPSSPSYQKLPYLYNKIHHNTIETTQRLKRHQRSLSSYDVIDFVPRKLLKIGISHSTQKRRQKSTLELTPHKNPGMEAHPQQQDKLYKYLSSKVDFFNQQNQRRLRLKKRKVMIDLGIVRQEKDKVIPANSQLGKVSPGMALLLKDYLLKRSIEENKNDFYYILGREV